MLQSTPPPPFNLGRSRTSLGHPPPPYSPDLNPIDFFLFSKVKELLDSQSLTLEMVKPALDRAMRCIFVGDFTASLGP